MPPVSRHSTRSRSWAHPCQIYAARKMQLYPFGARHIADKIALTVGIFCTENFSYAGLKTVIEDHCKVPIELRHQDGDRQGQVLGQGREGRGYPH